jgi:hypothetical protein
MPVGNNEYETIAAITAGSTTRRLHPGQAQSNPPGIANAST